MLRQIFARNARPLLAGAAAVLVFSGGCFSRGHNLVEEDRELTGYAAPGEETPPEAAGSDGEAVAAGAAASRPAASEPVRKLPTPGGEPQADAAQPTTRPSELNAAPMRVFVIQGEDVALGEDAVPSPPEGLALPAGLYRFRMVNKSVKAKYFWLRRVAQGGESPDGETVIVQQVPEEDTRDHPVLLEPGDYYYSAPMPPNAARFNLTVR